MSLLRLQDEYHIWRDAPFLLSASRGSFGDDVKVVHKFGFNPDVDTVEETVWDTGGLYVWPLSADVLSVVSTSASDTAGGAGAQTATLYGLDADYNEISETVILNGITPVLSTLAFLRIFRMRIEPLVSGGVTVPGQNDAVGDITATFNISGDIGAAIKVGNNQTLMALYTIPAGYTGFMYHGASGTARNEEAEIKYYVRPINGVFNVAYDVFVAESTTHRPFEIPVRINEKTDLEVRARNTNLNVEVSANFDLLLIRNV